MSPLRPHQLMRRLLACLGFLWLTSVPLLAHHLPPGMEDVDEFEDGMAFMAGLRHPLLGWDHWLFAVAVGVVAAWGASRFSRAAPVASLLLATMAGAACGLQRVILPVPACALGIAVLAVMISVRARSPGLTLSTLLITMLAFWQGDAHGMAWPLHTGGVWYLTGIGFMTAALAGCGLAVTRVASISLGLKRPASATSH